MHSRDDLAAAVAKLAHDGGPSVATAESLTGGMVAAALAASEGASGWFRGAVVAYASEVKYDLLGVPDGPVVSAGAASAMADGVRRLLDADVAVSVTGAGGPDPQDDQPPGTVFLAVSDAGGTHVEHHRLSGDPGQVCGEAASIALTLLADRLRRLTGG